MGSGFPASMRSKITSALLFVTCGIPGVFIFLIALTILGMRLFDPRVKAPGWGKLIGGILVGAILILVGVGEFARPVYLVVFLSMPLSGWLYVQFLPAGPVAGILFLPFIAAMGWLAFWGVRRYYSVADARKRVQDDSKT
jgi:hypothetical protein